jgi:hypothetical protein
MLELIPHPYSAPKAVREIKAEVAKSEYGQLVVHFAMTATVDDIMLPEPVTYASRRDRLWATTCFETFARLASDPRYLELNFAPSTAWAAYTFGDYRTGMDSAALDPPTIDVQRRPDGLDLYMAVDLGPIAWLDLDAQWAVGLSAIIEEKDGTKSYWALAHPAGDKPDFHHADCFAAQLA